MRITLALLSAICFTLAILAQPRLPEIQNSAGLRMSVGVDDSNPALNVYVPDGPESARSSKILFPEHVTVRAHGQNTAQHLYIFSPGPQGYMAKWTKVGNGLGYERDFDQIHFTARATLVDDGIVFHYDFVNHSQVDYDMATAITDPRFHGVFYDPRLQRTYVHHREGFDLLASETPARLTMSLSDWFPVRYLASFTAPVPAERAQRRDDGITYRYKSRPVDVPFLATLSEDRAWVMASFARNPGNVWSNPELTCQHVDPEVPLPHGGQAAYEVKILLFKGSLEDSLRKALAQKDSLR